MQKKLPIKSINMPTLFFFVAILSFYNAAAQGYNFKPLPAIEQSARWMEVDKMKNLYLVLNDHTLLKYSPTGELLYRFNENTLGEITYVDISNPFRILVYYKDYTTIVFLDRTLSETRRHDLSTFDIPQVQALGTASDNNIWLFDNNTFTLKKISTQNQVIAESTDLNLLLSDDINPNRVIEFDSKVYMNAPNIGILVFDIFGTYIKTITLPDLDYFQLYEGQIFYVENKIFKVYNLFSFQTEEINLPVLEDNLQQVCIAQEHLYIKYADRINIFALSKK